jgi:hypothetical protein
LIFSGIFCSDTGKVVSKETINEYPYPVFGKDGNLGGASLQMKNSTTVSDSNNQRSTSLQTNVSSNNNSPNNLHDITGVFITLEKIKVHSVEAGWKEVINYGDNGFLFDLMALNSGNASALGNFSLEPGSYDELRFYIHGNNYVTVKKNNETQIMPLSIPSGQQSGIKLVYSFDITATGFTTITLDFDIERSLKFNKGRGFILNPVLEISDITTAPGAASLVLSDLGGTISLPNDINVSIPPGALSQDTLIEVVPIDPSVTQMKPFADSVLLSNRYELLPNGTQFINDITLAIHYDPDEITSLNIDESTLEIVYYDTIIQDWKSIGGSVDFVNHIVTATVNHFTTFGVAGGGGGAKINPAEIRYAGYDPVTLSANTAVPELIAATVTPKVNTTITSVTLYIDKAGQNPNPVSAPMVLNTVTGEYEYTLDPMLFYPEVSTVTTPTYDIRVMIEATDSAGAVKTAPSGSISSDSTTWHLYSYDPDQDADGMNDRWEVDNLLDPTLATDSLDDLDGDGLTNLEEYKLNRSPNIMDSQPHSLLLTYGEKAIVSFWDALPQASSFNLYWSNNPGVTKSTGTKITGVTNGYRHSGLNENLAYYYVVTAVYANGVESPESIEQVIKPGKEYWGTVSNLSGFQGGATSGTSSVVVGAHGMIYRTVNNVDWSPVKSGTQQNLNDVTYGSNRYVAIGSGATILISADGLNWSQVMISHSLIGTAILNRIVWNGTKFVVTGMGAIYTSNDGLRWTEIIPNPSMKIADNRFHNIVWTGSKFVIFSHPKFSYIYTSSDGITWSRVANTNLPILVMDVEYSPALNLYVGVSDCASIYSSYDLVTWTLQNGGGCSGLKTPLPGLSTIVYDGTNFIAMGRGGNMYISADGISWVNHITGSFNYTASFNNGIGAIALGSGGSIQYSADGGINWTLQKTSVTNTYYDIIWAGGQYVAVGSGVSTSPDGYNWTQQSVPPGIGIFTSGGVGYAVYLNAAAYSGTKYVAVGYSSTIIVSNDGKNWSKVPLNFTYNFYDVVWNGSSFITMGNWGGNSSPVILISVDGTNWTPVQTALPSYSYTFLLHNGRIYAVGASGDIVSSMDGMTWTNVSPANFDYRWGRLTWDGTQFIMASSTGISISADLQSWSKVASARLFDVLFNGSKYIAVGEGETILESFDGIIWFVNQGRQIDNDYLHSVASNGFTTVAVGTSNNMIFVSPQ